MSLASQYISLIIANNYSQSTTQTKSSMVCTLHIYEANCVGALVQRFTVKHKCFEGTEGIKPPWLVHSVDNPPAVNLLLHNHESTVAYLVLIRSLIKARDSYSFC